MSETLPVLVRGWAICDALEEAVIGLLGEAVQQTPLNFKGGGWRVEDPVLPEQPVGPLRSLVTFESDEPLYVIIVPGSYGQPAPLYDFGHEVVSLRIGRTRSLVLDARCLYKVAMVESLRLRLWLNRPARAVYE